MRVEVAMRVLQQLLDAGQISKTDELVVVGSGDRISGPLDLTVLLPHVKLERVKPECATGHYGLGFVREEFPAVTMERIGISTDGAILDEVCPSANSVGDER